MFVIVVVAAAVAVVIEQAKRFELQSHKVE